ncbi:MAG: hypothetical protein LBM16_03660 [Clostridiales bacterium]|jgi:hypothetical protein|nr:hypothetical protein [Clostridiales bacterium]
MFTPTFMAKFKQRNISTDHEKTKLRTREAWETLSNKQKNEILALADVVRTTIYRVFSSGTAHPRIIISFSAITGWSPLYFSGHSDEHGELTTATLNDFLNTTGYSNLVGTADIDLGKTSLQDEEHLPIKRGRKSKQTLAEEAQKVQKSNPALELYDSDDYEEDWDACDCDCDDCDDCDCDCDDSDMDFEEYERTMSDKYPIMRLVFPQMQRMLTKSESEIDAAKFVSDDDALALFKALLVRAKTGSSKELKDLIIIALLS